MLLPDSYALCDAIARKKARNFYYGFKLLAEPRRLAMSAMYAWFRACDDIVDDAPGTPQEQATCLQEWRRATLDALDGAAATSDILPAFADAVQRYAIPRTVFTDLLDGALMDLDTFSYETFDDLYEYCRRVASTVGLVCVHVFGFDGSEDALEMAEWCGIAFQLTNILRDIEEDASMGRTYLPQEDLRRFKLTSEDLKRGVMDERFTALMAFETARARDFYDRSRPLFGRVDADSRPALEAMVGIYRSLLDKIERQKYRVFGRRISLSKAEKLGLMARALVAKTTAGAR